MGMESATVSNTDRQFNLSLEVACDYPDAEKVAKRGLGIFKQMIANRRINVAS